MADTLSKFLDQAGTGYLWDKIKYRYDSKLDEITAGDASIVVEDKSQVRVAVSPDGGNLLQINPDKGLYVDIPDGSLTKEKMDQDINQALTKANRAVYRVEESVLDGYITLNGVDFPIHGLKSAAFQTAESFDPAGAAAIVLGTDEDEAGDPTVYGAINLATDVYAAISPLGRRDIDNIVESVDSTY